MGIFYAFDSTIVFTFILLASLVLMIFLNRKKIDKTKISALDKEEFFQIMRKGTLVDIRKPEKFKEDKILGARNYPGSSGAKDALVRKDLPIFIYDEDGQKAYNVAVKYVKEGAIKVYYLKGGIKKK